MTVAKKPVAGESTKETVKTIARGMPGDFRCDLTYARAFYRYHCTRGNRAPGIPCALSLEGKEFYSKPRADRAARSRSCVLSSLRANGSRECAPDDRLREAIHTLFVVRWIASLRSQ
jgi:hypothetical protein